MKKIMILGGGPNQIGLLQSAEKCGYIIVLCDKNADCPGKRYADVFYPIDIINVAELVKKAKEENIDGVVSNSEIAMEVVAEIASTLGLIGNGREAIATLSSKNSFRDFQQFHGFYSPKHIRINKTDELEAVLQNFNFPIIVKPVKCSGSRGTTKFDEENLVAIKKAVIDCIEYSRDKTCAIEEYVEMPSLTVLEGDIFVNKRDIFWGGLFFTKRSKELPMVPMTYMSPYLDTEEHINIIKHDISQVFACLGIYHGQYNVEAYFDSKNNFFIIEINARQGGHGLPGYVKLATGVDMDKMLVTTSVGDNDYFNEIKRKGVNQKYATRHSLFCNKNGILRDIYIDNKIKKFVVNFEINKKVGEFVEKRKNGSSAIGFVNLIFNTFEEQHNFSEKIEEYIYPLID